MICRQLCAVSRRFANHLADTYALECNSVYMWRLYGKWGGHLTHCTAKSIIVRRCQRERAYGRTADKRVSDVCRKQKRKTFKILAMYWHMAVRR